MNGSGPKLEPKGALDAAIEAVCFDLPTFEAEKIQSAALIELASLRSQLTALQAENEGLKADRKALETVIKRMTGAGETALAALHAPKSEVNSQPEIPPVAEKA